MIVGHIGGAGAPYEIQKSLRFRASASAYLSRTPLSSSNRRTWTFSAHIKRGALGARAFIFSAGTATTNDAVFTSLEFAADSSLRLSGGVTEFLKTSLLYRDCSAAYHLVCSVDTTKATAQDRIKLFINGVQLTSFSTANYPAQNSELAVNYNWATYIGAYFGGLHFDGYLSEINFIDGQALDASYFGQVSAETGAWIPKKYTGTYGTNGFYLPFNDGSTLGNLTADRSGNGNNWTANNISLTPGVTYDWMDDTPTNNYCTMNPLKKNPTLITASDGNLLVTNNGDASILGTQGMSSGKWYWEVTLTNNGTNGVVGISSDDATLSQEVGGAGSSWGYIGATGNKYSSGSGAAYGATYTTNDVIGITYDVDTGTLTFYKNNTSQGAAYTGLSSSVVMFPAVGNSNASYACNFGQRPFAYSPPAGFKALCTKNLQTPTGAALNPKRHFDVVLATGANIKSTVEALYSDQALMVVKDRANANNWQWFNDVTGLSAILQSNTTSAETTYSAPTGSSVGYGWKAGGAPVINNAGSIQSQVSANPQAGFSIVTYTGTGANATVGHGLGVAPKFIVFKSRGVSRNWLVETTASGSFQYAYLNLTNSALSQPHASPTSAVMTLVSGAPEFNQSGETYVAYCFAEIPGFSKIGSYIGNGSADGPFVYCGFRPRFVLVKLVSAPNYSWEIFDTARSPYNESVQSLHANVSDSEYTSLGTIDILSNGFKARNTRGEVNSSGGSYMYIAFAEAPFQFANAR